ncbi:MAG: SUMF1/EgtB/PvdO family nonheme iron enzyme [Planctomycetota bacterium]
MPVSGLSLRQARIAAELLGGHLMSDAEFALATAGGLAELVYPWGSQFSAQIVVADPDRLSSPLAVDSAPEGSSPAGILNLVGNVAEILAPDAQERGQLAGGHYLSRASELRADARIPMGEPRDQHDLAGFRLARFVPLENDDRDLVLVESRIVEITSRQELASFCDWRLDARGSLQLEATLIGQGSEAAARSAFDSASQGFLLRGQVRRSIREGSDQQFVLAADMQAGGGLFNRNGTYFMSLPLGGGHSGASLTRLDLPDRLSIDLVDIRYVENGRQILLWDLPARSGAAGLNASLRFRRDGPLGANQPVLAELEPFLASFFSALERGESEILSGLLDRSYQQLPHQLRWAELTGTGPSRLVPKEAWEGMQIVDATTVGDIVTVWLKGEWRVENREGRQVTLKDWRLRAQLRTGPQGYRVLSLVPLALADQGEQREGSYVGPERLKVSLAAPAGVFIQRGHHGLSELQVTCWPEELQDVSLSLFGEYSEPGTDEDLILHRLTQGALSAQPGRRLQGPKVAFLGSREEGSELRAETVQDWLFGRPGGDSWSRERWIFVQLGRRWFFVRQQALGSSPDQAKGRFQEATESFKQIQRSLHIR